MQTVKERKPQGDQHCRFFITIRTTNHLATLFFLLQADLDKTIEEANAKLGQGRKSDVASITWKEDVRENVASFSSTTQWSRGYEIQDKQLEREKTFMRKSKENK